MDIFKTVWGEQEGFVFVPRKKGNKWDEGRAFEYPAELQAVEARVQLSIQEGYDTYWCPLVFDKPKRLKENVSKARYLWADLDYVDPTMIPIRPTVAWKSSDERYQCLWELDGMYDITEVEPVNKHVSYEIGADKGGWDTTQVLRVVDSPNFKYTPPQQGKLLWNTTDRMALDTLKKMRKPVKKIDVLEGHKIPQRTLDLLNTSEKDVVVGERSDRLWEIETSLIEAGVPFEVVVEVVKNCPFNKYKERPDGDEQIYREVLKAEKHVKDKYIIDVPISTDWLKPYEQFVTDKIKPPEWLIDGIWQAGSYGMIAGEPKTYKSVLSTDMALSVASGKPFLGVFKVNQTGAVICIQEENSEALIQDRVLKIAHHKGLTIPIGDGTFSIPDSLPIHFSNNTGIDLTSLDSRKAVEEALKRIKPIMLILDPLYLMLGAVNENDATEVRNTLRWLTSIRNEFGCAIVVCHHYNKHNDTKIRGGQKIRGTGAFHAWVESALYLKKQVEDCRINMEREFRAYPITTEIPLKIELGMPQELYYLPQIIEETDQNSGIVDIKKEEVVSALSGGIKTFEEIKKETKLSQAELRIYLKDLERDMIIARETVGIKTYFRTLRED